MAPQPSMAIGAALLATLVAVLPVRSQPQLPPPNPIEIAPEPPEKVVPEPGVQPLEKAPIHEAFAQPGADVRGKGLVAPKAPPPPIPELPPDTKPEGENVKWVPGYWYWDAERNDFIWISGIYRNAPAGREWQPGEWTKAKDGTFAYAPGFWRPTNMNSWRIDLPEPPKTVENGPNTPPDNRDSVWIPGIWEYRNGQYVWRPGYWAQPNGDLLWQPGQYLATGSGYCYIPGYWDCPFEDRGLLYAPVFFTQPLWRTPGWCFRPRFAVGTGFGTGWGSGVLFDSLFIGPGFNNYFYGNWWNPAGFGGGAWLGVGSPFWGSPWLGLGSPLWGPVWVGGWGGFMPWWGVNRGFCNPTWRNYCWLNRGNPNYAKNVQSACVSRALGATAQPVARVAPTTQRGVGGAVSTGVRAATATAARPLTTQTNSPLVQPANKVAQSLTSARTARTTPAPSAVAGANGNGANTTRANPSIKSGVVTTTPKSGGVVTTTPKSNSPVAQGNPIHAGVASPKVNTGSIQNPGGVRVQSVAGLPGAGIANPQQPSGRLDRDLPQMGGVKLDRPPITIQNPATKGGGNTSVPAVPRTNTGGVLPGIGSQPNLPASPVIRSQPSTPAAPVYRPTTPTFPTNPGGAGRIIGGPAGGGGGGGRVIGGMPSGGGRPGGGPVGGGGRPVGGGGGRPGGGGKR